MEERNRLLGAVNIRHYLNDLLLNVHEYDARDFGTDSHEKALLLGLDVLRDI